eukprot:1390422-Rhodomonas_salina.1
MSSRQLDTERRTLFLTLGGYSSVPETYPLDLASEFSYCLEPESDSPLLDSQPRPGCPACGVSFSCLLGARFVGTLALLLEGLTDVLPDTQLE